MVVISRVFRSSIGRKTTMALTGAALVLFLFAHLSGNLLLFAGQDAMNAYGVTLRQFPILLWVARIGLIVVFVTHVVIGTLLTIENRRARPERYHNQKSIQSTPASRSMMITGLLLLAYLVYHLLHFTLGETHSQYFNLTDAQGRHDIYSMVVLSFQQWPISVAYIIAMGLLAFHLSHGIPSLFQSIGWNGPRFMPLLSKLGLAIAVLLLLGYISIPVAVLSGIIGLP
ncbi:MAG: succinate dehydrogenase cytochrome b subunit [Spirochaetales bacterium]|nr:succinate dehydrogenase cytochrome b subunit [Leptospiraceae bacterium]MCP5479881.1 succinate dehydrogenase cytochrome b subunit [Spirochaetales bacterium]MCP5486271.1 succinate dehydrogenase cytochrome b subunit [Spirochaetales bacterium]